jgi:hypothetical protein
VIAELHVRFGSFAIEPDLTDILYQRDRETIAPAIAEGRYCVEQALPMLRHYL